MSEVRFEQQPSIAGLAIAPNHSVPPQRRLETLNVAGAPGLRTPKTWSRETRADEGVVWAEMLSRVGDKLCRLSEAVEKRSDHEFSGRRSSIVQEMAKERARLARELHAGAGQPLSGIKLNLEILHEGLHELSPRAQQALGRLETLAEQALQQLRAVSHRLHPPAWQDLTVAKAIQELVETSGINAHFDVSISAPPLQVEPDHTVKLALYRCAQECLSNIVRHSGATAVQLTLREESEMIVLQVSDNGHGFETGRPAAGIGVRALNEHTAALGGTCRIQSGTTGTTVEITLPVDGDN